MGDPSGQLSQQKRMAGQRAMNAELGKESALRKISLNRLEKALEELAPAVAAARRHALPGRADPHSVRVLLSRVGRHRDRRSGGRLGRPIWRAASWASTAGGRCWNCRTWSWRCGRSRPGKAKAPVIGCSIDPTPEGLAKMQQFLATVGRTRRRRRRAVPCRWAADEPRLAEGERAGVSPKTHFAQVMVEADYRMKLIGIGAGAAAGAKLVTYVARADPASVVATRCSAGTSCRTTSACG